MDNIEVILTEEELNVAVKTYQKRLRLLDWTIKVNLVPQQLIEKGAQAAVKLNLARKDAKIAIATAESYVGSTEDPQNMLLDLYHELVHIVFPMITLDGSTEYELFEHGVETIASALFFSEPFEGRDVSDDNYNIFESEM